MKKSNYIAFIIIKIIIIAKHKILCCSRYSLKNYDVLSYIEQDVSLLCFLEEFHKTSHFTNDV